MAKGNTVPEGMIRLRHPSARSCSFAGRVFEADRNGVVTVPAEAASELVAHGFEAVSSVPKETVE
jgi:hypothetical protein